MAAIGAGLAAVITGGVIAGGGWISRHAQSVFEDPNPVVVGPIASSPATTQRGSAEVDPPPSVAASSPIPSPTLTQDSSVYLFRGERSAKELPPPSDKMKGEDTLGIGNAYWYVPLTTPYLERVLIATVTVTIVKESPPTPFTEVQACWNQACTSTLDNSPPICCPMGVEGPTFQVNLDKAPSSGRIILADQPVSITAGDPTVISLGVTSSELTREWEADITWATGQERGTKHLDDNGKPFRVEAGKVVRTYCYDSGDPRGYADINDAQERADRCVSKPPAATP